MLKTLNHFLSLIRFSHTVFALPFALLAAVMAWFWTATESDKFLRQNSYIASWVDLGFVNFNYPIGNKNLIKCGSRDTATFLERCDALATTIRWQELVGILLCMVFARSAAMAFNRVVDRHIDAANPRTATRHIPAGILSATTVWIITAALSVAFVVSTLLFLPNWLPFYLSVPVLLFLCGYSYTKRFTSFAHFWLGAALALTPIAAWIAIRGEQVIANRLDLLPAVVLGAAVATWVAGFDIIYACQDHEFDRQAKLRSVPTWLGVRGALRLAAACHCVTVVLLAALPIVYPPLGVIYLAAIGMVAGLLVYEHWIISPEDLGRVNIAFFNVNAVISLGLFAVGVVDLLV